MIENWKKNCPKTAKYNTGVTFNDYIITPNRG